MIRESIACISLKNVMIARKLLTEIFYEIIFLFKYCLIKINKCALDKYPQAKNVKTILPYKPH